ncbi:hypothetical protein MVEN_01149100 [Mycena venus]|uniref:Uncharacterized protein n=1 Tax=Mycena venus TaxID=2733690 RepID=A0A8H6Y4M7_9AGAR|nr:hypothetical protein MVEN_01149100 [Mycena venus]
MTDMGGVTGGLTEPQFLNFVRRVYLTTAPRPLLALGVDPYIEVSPRFLCLRLGTVASAHPYLVPYVGPTLVSDTVYLWTVTFATRARTASTASSNFRTGFLAQPASERVTLFTDGHYRRVIYGLGPYIADYPEHVLLACVVQGWCPRCTASKEDLDGRSGRRTQAHTESLFDALDPDTMWDEYRVVPDVLPFTWDFLRADIYELLSPDLLHQVIKGTSKDHLVTWVGEYLESVHGKSQAKKIMADIDRRWALHYSWLATTSFILRAQNRCRSPISWASTVPRRSRL